MTYYWVESDTGEKGTITADNKSQAKKLARFKLTGKIKSINVLPYPADPVLNGTEGMPPFCWKPDECKGHTSCPRNPVCID